MVGLTYTPPLQPGLAVPPAAAQAAGGAVIVDVSSARAAGAVQNSLGEALLEIAGPGNIITGRVTTLSADGSLTLTTDSGAQISFHHPPEVPLTLGSVITVRIVSAGATPQVTLLAVDGKPVVARPGSTPQPPAGASAASPAAAPRAGAMPGADSASAYAASLAAVLSLEDEATAGQAVGRAGAADAPAELSATLLESVLAVLIRAMPARPGLAPVPVGTSYIADLVASAPLSSASAAPAGSPATAPPVDPGAEESADFQPQTASLSGRVLPPGPDGRILVETALGTLALPAGVTLAAGTAVRLDITAVAPPSTATAAVSPAGPSGFLEQILNALIGGTAALAEQAGEMLALPATTGERLLAAAWAFVVDAKRRVAVRDLATVVRQALADAGRTDLAERFGASTANLGTVRPPATPEGWTVVTLPFLGLAGEQPVRVYTRKAGQDGEGGDRPGTRGERVVVEVTLTRLGAMQFDGLVRERRFDLVIRTPGELDPGLRAVIDRAFQGALAECGYGGDLLYGRTLTHPLVPPERAGSAIGFSV